MQSSSGYLRHANLFLLLRHVAAISAAHVSSRFPLAAKRLIGRKFEDAAVQSDIKLWPFEVKPGPASKPMIFVDYKGERKEFAAEEISSMVLIKMCVSRLDIA